MPATSAGDAGPLGNVLFVGGPHRTTLDARKRLPDSTGMAAPMTLPCLAKYALRNTGWQAATCHPTLAGDPLGQEVEQAVDFAARFFVELEGDGAAD